MRNSCSNSDMEHQPALLSFAIDSLSTLPANTLWVAPAGFAARQPCRLKYTTAQRCLAHAAFEQYTCNVGGNRMPAKPSGDCNAAPNFEG